MRELSSQQSRQLIDCEQLFESFRLSGRELAQRYTGSMAWKTVKGRAYLYRKGADRWTSVGPRNAQTEEAHTRFHAGRDALRTRLGTLDEQLRAMAPVNRALGLGRLPLTSAGLLRKIDRLGWLDGGIKVAGTHAIYAYERMAGVHLGEEAVSTMDVDLLYDARRRLKLLSADRAGEGLIGLLQRQDRTFRPTEASSFRAVNDAGFMVDFITPASKSQSTTQVTGPLGKRSDDLVPVEIAGLAWLENVPSVSRTVLDERGFPLAITVPDLRAFICHKAWLARRDDRDPLKRGRDLHQARTLARMLATRLPFLRFDDPSLKAVPLRILALGRALVEAAGIATDGSAWND